MDRLDDAIRDAQARAYVLFASSADPQMRYLTGFRTSDRMLYLKRPDEPGLLCVPQMEYERAVRESGCAVMTLAEAGFFELLKEEGDLWRARGRLVESLVGGDILVPPTFPAGLAAEIREARVIIDHEALNLMRSVKTDRETAIIRKVQKAAEAAMDAAIALIRASEPRNGVLHLQGAPLTSEAVKVRILTELLSQGCTATDTIVSSGPDSALPHHQGSGPLHAAAPIVIDIFPRDELTGYHADMTRTVIKGKPSDEVMEMYKAVKNAQDLAERLIAPGVAGSDLHQSVVDSFHERGYDRESRARFTHSLGHGVGLEVHEAPSLSPSGGPLKPGNVITIEPGLYCPGVGGIRLEDMGVVTSTGFDLFTNFPREFLV